MSGYYLTDDQWIKSWSELGSPQEFAKVNNIAIRNVYSRRRLLESKYGIKLPTFASKNPAYDKNIPPMRKIEQTPGQSRRGTTLEKGRVVVFSDAHFWPDDVSTAYKALLLIIKEFKPSIIVANGDMFDGSQASRHARIGWEKTPSVAEELEACKYMMEGIEKAAVGAELIWTLGNHDARFETFLSAQTSMYEGVSGFTLKDHFPHWQPCWSYWINEDTCVKHRWKGGWSAGRSNSLNSGVNIVTGHTHQLTVHPLSDYNGTRYGIQTGTLADPNAEQFIHYTEDGPKDWRSGFALLSFVRGRLMLPELIQVCGEDEFEFRGCINKV
jgi:predicted phosphodiesterase